MGAMKSKSPVYLWVWLSPMEQAIWANAFASAKGSAQQRARIGDQTVRSLRTLVEARESDFGPEYEAARALIRLDVPEFAAWYRVQYRLRKGRLDEVPSDQECQDAFDRYQMGLSDFY